MNAWQWESFAYFLNSGLFGIANAGPLSGPISSFTIARDENLQLWLEIRIVGEPRHNLPPHPPGTVRIPTETVEFISNGLGSCVAKGIVLRDQRIKFSPEGVQETTQRASFHSLIANLIHGVAPAYTIEWLVNVDRHYFWAGSQVKDENRIIETRTIGVGDSKLELSSTDSQHSAGWHALRIVVDGMVIYICNKYDKESKLKPGYIVYPGYPDETTRKKVREAASFVLDNFLVYIGYTALSGEFQVVSIMALTPHFPEREIFDRAPLPTAVQRYPTG